MQQQLGRRQFIIAGACAVAAPAIVRAKSYKEEYKLSVVGNPPLGISAAATRWADLVREQTDGRINVKVYTSSQLVGGDTSRELVAMRQGVIDLLVSSSIYLAPQVREMNLFSLPFLLRNEAELDALTQGGPVRAALDEALAKRGATTLAWSDQGFRQLCNSKHPVRSPEQLRGMKIRFPAGQIYSDIFRSLGANPLQMAWADLQPALATGAVDGMETPVNTFLQVNLQSVNQRYMSIWNYVTDACMFKVSTPVWKNFNDADQEIIRACANQAAKEHVASTRKGMINGDDSAFKELASRGVTVEQLTLPELEVFSEAARPVFDKWAETTGRSIVDLTQTTLNKVRS